MQRSASCVVACLAVAAAWGTADALADDITRITPGTARAGERVTIVAEGFFGPKPQRIHAPVYLVPARLLPRPYRCQPDAFCYRRARTAPRAWPYTRVGALRHYTGGRVVFRVPRIAAGLYGVVVYCDVCFTGPGGILIANARGPKLRIRP